MRLNASQINELIALLEKEITPFFTSAELQQLAKDTSFDKRQSGKLNGEIFLKLILANRDSLKQQSLNGLCMQLVDTFGIEIKKQSLHERFNATAVEFLKSALEKLFAKQINRSEILTSVKGFSRILVKDSTCFDLSDDLAEKYKGSKGSASDAAARIQFEFDILSGTITAVSLNSYCNQDAADAKATVDMINPGELIIRDLGYMHLSVFKGIISKVAFFVSRLNPCCEVFDSKDGSRIDFKSLYKLMTKRNQSQLDLQVCIGVKERLPVRLLISLVPETVANQRIRRITLKRKRRCTDHTQVDENYKARCRFNLFITNASEDQIPISKVHLLYRFRWIIELVFKMWKSTWKIHEIKDVKLHRVECYLYARLIALVASWTAIWKIVHGANIVAKAAVSIDKCSKLFYNAIESVVEILCGNIENLKKMMKNTGRKINYLLIERHGERLTQMELIFELGNEI